MKIICLGFPAHKPDPQITPCPCGFHARTVKPGILKDHAHDWVVWCAKCGCQSDGAADETGAIANWNEERVKEK